MEFQMKKILKIQCFSHLMFTNLQNWLHKILFIEHFSNISKAHPNFAKMFLFPFHLQWQNYSTLNHIMEPTCCTPTHQRLSMNGTVMGPIMFWEILTWQTTKQRCNKYWISNNLCDWKFNKNSTISKLNIL